MSVVATPVSTAGELATRARAWLSPLNLHFAGVGLLVVVNVYLLANLAFLWQKLSSNGADALAQQRIALKTAQVGAEPLRGLDAKLEASTAAADRFYRQRLPATRSAVYAELGDLTRKENVRFTRAQYLDAPILAGSSGELTEMRIDASLSGDYRPLVQVINALERDKLFFVIGGVSLSGQQSGAVNLRLRLTTYLRGHVPPEESPAAAASAAAPAAQPAKTAPPATGVPQP
jgi:hypothetical protein